jgi:heme/copper-type cytochrome/quinol oxidase subunit 2
MKNMIISTSRKYFMLLVCMLFSIYSFAQDQGGTASQTSTNVEHTANTTTDTTTTWISNPIVWIVAGLVFVLLLVALLSGRNKGGGTPTSTTTIVKD